MTVADQGTKSDIWLDHRMTLVEVQRELEELRRHPPVQPVCTTCQRVSELTKIVKEQDSGGRER